MQTRFDRRLNVLVFGGFALAAVWRLFSVDLSARGVGHALKLLALSVHCYAYASGGALPRVLAIVVFLLGWFRSPLLGMGMLFVCWFIGTYRGAVTRMRKERQVKTASGEAAQGESKTQVAGGGMARMLLTMKIAAESEGRIRAFAVPFASTYGDAVIPLLLVTDEGECGIYIEPAPWSNAKEEACLRWLAALRTSDREDLDVEIRSDGTVPERLRFYCARSRRVVFELLGLLHVRVFEQADFGEENATTLVRLAHEYLDVDIGNGTDGLETLDRVIVEGLRPSGHILPSTILLAGSYFGQVLIAAYGGHWNVRGRTSENVTVEIASPTGTVNADVFGKVAKLFDNGIEDSTAWMARAIGGRLDSV